MDATLGTSPAPVARAGNAIIYEGKNSDVAFKRHTQQNNLRLCHAADIAPFGIQLGREARV
jgi:hypothetical protein